MLYAGLLAFASINLNADQTIGGTALNLLATALAVVIAKGVNPLPPAKSWTTATACSSMTSGPLTVNIFLFIGLAALILSYIVLYKTRLGLRLRACGEHPQAADGVGINVYKMRYIRRADFRRAGRHRRHGVHRPVRLQLEFRGQRFRRELPRAGGYDLR